MEILFKWLLLASVQTAATLSPGPAFAISVRNAIAYNRRVGILTALGLGAGISAHILFVLCGLSFIITQSVLIYNFIKYAGAAYLIFIGVKALKARKNAPENTALNAPSNMIEEPAAVKTLSDFKAFKIAFLTNLLNPKAVIFFTAVFTQFITPETHYSIMVLYFLTCVIIEITWFTALSFILNTPMVKTKFLRISHWIERVCGGLLIALGLKIALHKA